MEFFSFEKLILYQKSRELVSTVYKLLNKFPKEEKYALSDQIRRSVVSIPSNIAEQCGRKSRKEKRHFLEISFGSLMECYCQLQLAVDLNYIQETELLQIKPLFFEISRLISGLNNSLSVD